MTNIVNYVFAKGYMSGGEHCPAIVCPSPQPFDPSGVPSPEIPSIDGFTIAYPVPCLEDDDNRETCDRIVAASLQNDCVTSARVMEHRGCFVVAMLTTPFYQKSERDRARQLIESDLRAQFGTENLCVTFRVDIFRRIQPGITEEEKERLYAWALLH